jgi:elongation factor P--(R)-beta-lysine ligase
MAPGLAPDAGPSPVSDISWRPSATLATLRQRAALLHSVREFFRERKVMEVETPVVLSHTVTDPQIPSLAVNLAPPRYLHTSPEYLMKRLLAAGSGDIYQVCRTFRSGERSRTHNPEFTLIEWYRSGFNLQQIMTETAALVARLLSVPGAPVRETEFLAYRDAFQRELGCDALDAPTPMLADLCARHGLAPQSITTAARDDLLDFLVATQVGPRLGSGSITCLHHYPASQAALAQLDANEPRTALRFEVYVQGLELANGFVELADAGEQRRRFTADQAQRALRGLPAINQDPALLAALESGLPACAGVALGFDRVVMLATGAASIDEVMAFSWERA